MTSKLKEKLAALKKDAEPCAKLGISRADTTSPCIGYAKNKDGKMCEMCRNCESSVGYSDRMLPCNTFAAPKRRNPFYDNNNIRF